MGAGREITTARLEPRPSLGARGVPPRRRSVGRSYYNLFAVGVLVQAGWRRTATLVEVYGDFWGWSWGLLAGAAKQLILQLFVQGDMHGGKWGGRPKLLKRLGLAIS